MLDQKRNWSQQKHKGNSRWTADRKRIPSQSESNTDLVNLLRVGGPRGYGIGHDWDLRIKLWITTTPFPPPHPSKQILLIHDRSDLLRSPGFPGRQGLKSHSVGQAGFFFSFSLFSFFFLSFLFFQASPDPHDMSDAGLL